MIPRLGAKYDITIESIAKPRAEYQTDSWFELDLPLAPAVMVEDEIVVERADVALEVVEACLCRHLGLPCPKKTTAE
jgi:hypothetical protein